MIDYPRKIHIEAVDAWTWHRVTTLHGKEIKREVIDRRKIFWENIKWILEGGINGKDFM